MSLLGTGKCRNQSTSTKKHQMHQVISLKKSYIYVYILMGFPGGTGGKESICNAGDTEDVGLIPGLGKSPGGGHSTLLQHSCLENPMDRGALQTTIQRISKSWT